jgi:hypothetical protein
MEWWIGIFSFHDWFTRLPCRLIIWIYYELLKKTMLKSIKAFPGRWRAGLMDDDIFQWNDDLVSRIIVSWTQTQGYWQILDYLDAS